MFPLFRSHDDIVVSFFLLSIEVAAAYAADLMATPPLHTPPTSLIVTRKRTSCRLICSSVRCLFQLILRSLLKRHVMILLQLLFVSRKRVARDALQIVLFVMTWVFGILCMLHKTDFIMQYLFCIALTLSVSVQC